VVLPDFVTHYYLPDRRPFLSLSELDESGVAAVNREMAALRAAGRQLRPFGPRYMAWRRLTEARLRDLFVARGGQPRRAAPHYFVLGESPWFASLATGMRSIRVPLEALPPAVTSATYPDSFTAMGYGPGFGVPHEPRPYHGRVFLLDELDDLASTHGRTTLLDDASHDWRQWSVDAYIEVQLWSDDLVRDHLAD
jgi:hypothetical protein